MAVTLDKDVGILVPLPFPPGFLRLIRTWRFANHDLIRPSMSLTPHTTPMGRLLDVVCYDLSVIKAKWARLRWNAGHFRSGVKLVRHFKLRYYTLR